MNDSTENKTVAVVGAGISGIAAAHFLLKRNCTVELLDRSPEIGGRIATAPLGGRMVDFGGKNIGKRSHLFREFISENGNSGFEKYGSSIVQLYNGKIVSVVSAKNKFFAHFRRLLLFGLKDSLWLFYYMRKVLRDPRNGWLGGPYFNFLAKKFDDRPISSYFGEATVKRLIRLVTVRSNGAEPDEFYLGNFGASIGAMLDSYEVLERGMHASLKEFKEKVVLRLNSTVTQIVYGDDGKIGVVFEDGAGSKTRYYDHVILATPANFAAEVLAKNMPELAGDLRQIQYFPSAVAIVQYSSAVMRPDAPVLIFDEEHPVSVAAAYSMNNLGLIRYTLSGRKARQVISETTKPLEAIQIAERSLDPHFRVLDKNRESFVYKYFNTGACAYSPHHSERLQKIRERLKKVPRLSLCGDYMKASSIEGCFRSAVEAVDQI